jgi:hypothetical protein
MQRDHGSVEENRAVGFCNESVETQDAASSRPGPGAIDSREHRPTAGDAILKPGKDEEQMIHVGQLSRLQST